MRRTRREMRKTRTNRENVKSVKVSWQIDEPRPAAKEKSWWKLMNVIMKLIWSGLMILYLNRLMNWCTVWYRLFGSVVRSFTKNKAFNVSVSSVNHRKGLQQCVSCCEIVQHHQGEVQDKPRGKIMLHDFPWGSHQCSPWKVAGIEVPEKQMGSF